MGIKSDGGTNNRGKPLLNCRYSTSQFNNQKNTRNKRQIPIVSALSPSVRSCPSATQFQTHSPHTTQPGPSPCPYHSFRQRPHAHLAHTPPSHVPPNLSPSGHCCLFPKTKKPQPPFLRKTQNHAIGTATEKEDTFESLDFGKFTLFGDVNG